MKQDKPLTVGVFGGSFNPIHLGHALLAITTQQTKAYIDEVVLVPVYKHAVKRNLLPFEDRVNMCKLAISSFGNALSVSTIEQRVGASNGAMLQALKKEYPTGTRFVWICGDDFIRWMDKPKGIETLKEVSGLIVQRRLHKQDTADDETTDGGAASQNRFIQEPLDEIKLRRVADQLNLEVDFIYGELPHFSSTLVRRAPGHWRSFLTQSVVQYLDKRPHLLEQLIVNLEEEGAQEQQQKRQKLNKNQHRRTPSSLASIGAAGSMVLQGLDIVHTLQYERGRTGLYLSTGGRLTELESAQASTDLRLKSLQSEAGQSGASLEAFPEVLSLISDLKQVPTWLSNDRKILKTRGKQLSSRDGVDGCLARLSLVEKFNARIDVLIGATIRALIEILEDQKSDVSSSNSKRDVAELLLKWCEGKEALGRLRAFVCATGPEAPRIVKKSLKMRERLNQMIDTKERRLNRVLSLEAGFSSRLAAPETLHQLLRNVTLYDYRLMGCFASSTPLHVIHKFLENESDPSSEPHDPPNLKGSFAVEQFFDASTAAIDFLLSFAKALAASACAAV